MEKFTKLGLSKELTVVLEELDFKQPSEIQEKAIPLALAGKDIIGGSATGSGKTLAFASSIIENLKSNGKGVQALILTPTRELAEQVATSIRKFSENKKLNVLAVYGGVRIEPQMNKIPRADILVGTPGRILDHLDRKTLWLKNVKFLVLDEVDRMFDMGFSRDVEKIIRECPKERQTMLFSATISREIDYLAQKYTINPVEIAVESRVDPSKLKQVYYDIPDNKKFSLLVTLLKNEDADLVMVFCSTRRNVDVITDNLMKAGISAKAIHGGIDQRKRISVLNEFHNKGMGVLVCTDVAARGLDIKEVSHVYNYDVPADSKDYIHRIGRTARAGEKGKAITILASRDYEKFGNLVESEHVKISQESPPKLESFRIRMDFRKDGGKFGRGQRNSRQGRNNGGPRRDSGRGSRDSRGRSGNSTGKQTSGRQDSRKPSSRNENNSKSFGRRRR
jgi:ATP-dependent RNA helicase DeaD